MDKEKETKKPFKKAFEIILRGTPEVLSPIISTVASELRFEDWQYRAREDEDSWSTAYRKFIIEADLIMEGSSYMDHIGIVTLQLLPPDQTLFRIPPFQQWFFGGIRAKNFYQKTSESFFTEFLTRVFAEFQRLGFIDFKEEKPPIGFRLPHKE